MSPTHLYHPPPPQRPALRPPHLAPRPLPPLLPPIPLPTYTKSANPPPNPPIQTSQPMSYHNREVAFRIPTMLAVMSKHVEPEVKDLTAPSIPRIQSLPASFHAPPPHNSFSNSRPRQGRYGINTASQSQDRALKAIYLDRSMTTAQASLST